MTAPIKVFWWRWKYPHRLNFGDEITAPLLERVTGRKVLWADLPESDVVGAGSVIEMAVRRRGEHQPRIWGSGFISAPIEGEVPAELDVRAIRGRHSLARVTSIHAGDIALGDPGLLAPLLVDGAVKKRYPLGVIAHYRDSGSPVLARLRALGSGVRVIDVGWTPQEVAREIASCDAVISSSLHGLIFSDALGVPNAHISLGSRLKGGLYKFGDYYSAFKNGASRYRSFTVPAPGLPALSALVDDVVEGFAAPTGVEGLQSGLVKALDAL